MILYVILYRSTEFCIIKVIQLCVNRNSYLIHFDTFYINIKQFKAQ